MKRLLPLVLALACALLAPTHAASAGQFPFSFWKPAKASFNPATLALTGWWRDYPTPPGSGNQVWHGTPSAGTSGGHDLAQATASSPRVGTTLNGHQTATCHDGVGTYSLATTATGVSTNTFLSDYYATLGYSGWLLFFMNSATADNPSDFPNPGFFSANTVALVGTSFSTLGTDLWQFDGSWHGSRQACAPGAWHLLRWVYDTTVLPTIKSSLDGGAFGAGVVVTTGYGGFDPTTQPMRMCATAYQTGPLDGTIGELGLTNVLLSPTDLDNVRQYIDARYGFSF